MKILNLHLNFYSQKHFQIMIYKKNQIYVGFVNYFQNQILTYILNKMAKMNLIAMMMDC